MMLCVLTVTIQIGVCFLMMKQLTEKGEDIYYGTTGLNCARFVSSILMHLNLYPGIRDPLDMITYCIFYKKKFFQ